MSALTLKTPKDSEYAYVPNINRIFNIRLCLLEKTAFLGFDDFPAFYTIE
jgi:hypothetical protein